MKDIKLLVEELEKIEEIQNKGRGVQCVKTILFYLRNDMFNEALKVRQWEGDKTRSYPELENKLYEIFGCRLHGIHDCDAWLCKGEK